MQVCLSVHACMYLYVYYATVNTVYIRSFICAHILYVGVSSQHPDSVGDDSVLKEITNSGTTSLATHNMPVCTMYMYMHVI